MIFRVGLIKEEARRGRSIARLSHALRVICGGVPTLPTYKNVSEYKANNEQSSQPRHNEIVTGQLWHVSSNRELMFCRLFLPLCGTLIFYAALV